MFFLKWGSLQRVLAVNILFAVTNRGAPPDLMLVGNNISSCLKKSFTFAVDTGHCLLKSVYANVMSST